MRTMRLYALRTFAVLARDFAGTIGTALFLSVTAAFFTRALVQAEGTLAALPVLWATAASATLPCLLALVTMRLISDDRLSGRLELLLTSPVLERDYVMGRYFGAMMYVALVLAAYLAVPVLVLPFFAGSALEGCVVLDFLPALAGLLLQAVCGCAVGLLASACFVRAATACAMAVFLLLVLPRAIYWALVAWSPAVRSAMPIFPAEVQLADAASGVFSFAGVFGCVVFAAVAVFLAVKMVEFTRLVGWAARVRRWSALLEMLLAVAFAAAVVTTAATLDFHLTEGGRSSRFSPRTLSILGDAQGDTRISCFLSKRHPSYRNVFQLLRKLELAARAEGGARLEVHFIDPRWDLSAATRLMHLGVKEGSLLFERGSRRVEVGVDDADESACASAILRLSLPVGRKVVYFTVGHGELAIDSYDPAFGLSSLSRALKRDGYELKELDTLHANAIPGDCGVLVVAGARMAFSEAELAGIDAYLRRGGRIMALVAASAPKAGIARLLADWGVRVQPFIVVSPSTLDGADLVARDYGRHEITAPLEGTYTVFHDALPIEAVPVAAGGESSVFTPLVKSDAESWGETDVLHRPCTRDAAVEPSGPLVLAAAVERGAGRRDIAVKPTRLVVTGDASFVVDGALASRANANRDFFRNALAWLAGLDAATASATPADALVTGMDRASRIRFAVTAVFLLPLVILLVAVVRWLAGRRM